MIEAKLFGSKVRLVCECGNSKQDTIFNFAKSLMATDQRGRQKLVRVKAYRCSICGEITTHKEAYAEVVSSIEKERDGQKKAEEVN